MASPSTVPLLNISAAHCFRKPLETWKHATLKVEREIDIPDELNEALDADPELAEAFLALTPGRQRSYMFNLNQAKQSATRSARIENLRDKIMAGKGALER